MKWLNVIIAIGWLGCYIKGEKFYIESLRINHNTTIPCKQFVYSSNTNNNNSFEYNITINNDDNNNINDIVLHLHLIKTDLLGFNLMKYPGICCSNTGEPILCMNLPENTSPLLSSYSIYNKTFSLSTSNHFTSSSIPSSSFIGHTSLFLTVCNISSSSPSFHINAAFTFDSTISHHFHFSILLLFLLLTFLSSVYWYIHIFPFSPSSLKLDIKLFTILPLLITSSYIISIYLHYITHSSGNMYMHIFLIKLILQLICNVFYKGIFFLVSIGYTFNLQVRLFKTQTRNIFAIPKNKVCVIAGLICCYVVVRIMEEVIGYKREFIYGDCYNYYMAGALKVCFNCFIWYGIYTRINKKSEFQMNTFRSIKMYFKQYNRVIVIAFGIGGMYYACALLERIVQGRNIERYVEGGKELLKEMSEAVFYFGLIGLLVKTPLQYNVSNGGNKGELFYEMQSANINSIKKIE